MAGIVSYGAYIPKMRLNASTANWKKGPERAIANFDEDAVTMAVAAASNCLRGFDRSQVDALFLASTSLPYTEKQSAPIVAGAIDLRPDIASVDVAHSLRAGSQALRTALDGVAAGSFRTALVIASDYRQAEPGSDLERNGGDGAFAVLVARDDPAVEILASHAIARDILDVWRSDGDRLLRSTPEEHFRYEEGYLAAMSDCVRGVLAKSGKAITEFDRVALYAPDPRRHAEAVRRLGLDPKQVVEMPRGIGCAGVADALVRLGSGLDEARPGELILLVNYGDGADALVLRTTSRLADARSERRPLSAFLEGSVGISDYYDFLRWRGLGPVSLNGARVAPSPNALFREQDEVLRMHGMRCLACGMVQYPPQRVCVRCQAKDQSEPVRMTDGGATLFSYSLDYVAATPDVPLLHGVIDFEVGGRAMMLVTDRDLSSVGIGMKLELTFRKFSEADGIHTYLWKAAPAR